MVAVDSDSETENVTNKDDSKSSLLTVGLSVATSLAILTWALMPPKRALQKSKEGGSVGLVERIRQRRDLADEYRAYAESLDRQLMLKLEKSRERWPVPGIREVRERWEMKVKSTKRRVDQLKGAKRGSIEWIERQELLKSLEDGPR